MNEYSLAKVQQGYYTICMFDYELKGWHEEYFYKL